MVSDSDAGLLDEKLLGQTREARLFGLMIANRVLFLRRYWKEDLPDGSLPTARQVHFWQDRSVNVAAITGRKVLKTTYIESLVIGEPLRYTKGSRFEALFTAPADAHIDPTLDRIEARMNQEPLFNALKESYNKQKGALHWKTGYWWHFRIEGVDGTGRNMVGLRANFIIGDEQSFGAEKAHYGRVQVDAEPGVTPWLYTGVPNGVRLTPFWRIDNEPGGFGAGWSVHRMTSYENPKMRTPQGRLAMHNAYKDENEYKNNVLGAWGEERASSFPSGHLGASRDESLPFTTIEVTDTQALLRQDRHGRTDWIALFTPLLAKCALVGLDATDTVLGIDHGYSPDPTVISVMYRHGPKSDACGEETWCQLARIQLRRISASNQALAIDTLHHLLDAHLGGNLGMIMADMAGYGRAVYMDALYADQQYDNSWYRAHCQDAAFGSSELILDAEGNSEVDSQGRVAKKGRKQLSTELLKDAFASNLRHADLSLMYAV